MPGTAKKSQPPGRPKDLGKRDAILDAAKRLFATHGFDGTSMDAIAKTAEVSKLTVYSHFGDKESLFREVVAADGQAYFASVRLVPENIAEFAGEVHDLAIEHPALLRMITWARLEGLALTEETGTTIDIAEDGTITIASTDADKAAHAKKRIEEITAEVEVGKVYEGPITKILDFGALVNLLPGKDGLLHISQIAHQRVEKVTDFLKEGQVVKVKVLETDDKGRVKLSMKALLDRDTPPAAPAAAEERNED